MIGAYVCLLKLGDFTNVCTSIQLFFNVFDFNTVSTNIIYINLYLHYRLHISTMLFEDISTNLCLSIFQHLHFIFISTHFTYGYCFPQYFSVISTYFNTIFQRGYSVTPIFKKEYLNIFQPYLTKLNKYMNFNKCI
jgi:hypothetical protein